MNVLIVDDEPLARDELKFLLQEHSDVNIVGEAANSREALILARQTHPDAVFVDIRLPDRDGISLAKELIGSDGRPLLVFATAYDNHAIEAFSLDATDYILKPFSSERLNETMDRLRKLLQAPVADPALISTLEQAITTLNPQLWQKVKRITVQEEGRTLLINPEDIVFVVREGRDLWMHLKDNQHRCSGSLSDLEKKLAPHLFFRVHRAFLVNLTAIEEITPWFNGAYQLTMKDAQHSQVPVSRNVVSELWAMIQM